MARQVPHTLEISQDQKEEMASEGYAVFWAARS
jgi:hypothetical protein